MSLSRSIKELTRFGIKSFIDYPENTNYRDPLILQILDVKLLDTNGKKIQKYKLSDGVSMIQTLLLTNLDKKVEMKEYSVVEVNNCKKRIVANRNIMLLT